MANLHELMKKIEDPSETTEVLEEKCKKKKKGKKKKTMKEAVVYALNTLTEAIENDGLTDEDIDLLDEALGSINIIESVLVESNDETEKTYECPKCDWEGSKPDDGKCPKCGCSRISVMNENLDEDENNDCSSIKAKYDKVTYEIAEMSRDMAQGIQVRGDIEYMGKEQKALKAELDSCMKNESVNPTVEALQTLIEMIDEDVLTDDESEILEEAINNILTDDVE